jgi:hypothetical protein
VTGEPPERGDLVRLAAIVELLLGTAQSVGSEFVGEALMADLYELRDRVHVALDA